MHWLLPAIPSPVVVSVLLLLLVVLPLTAAVCDGDEEAGVVRGLILDVVDRSRTEIQTLRVRDRDGRTWTFTTEQALAKDGAHLRLHQVLGEEITVLYVTRDGVLIATDLRD